MGLGALSLGLWLLGSRPRRANTQSSWPTSNPRCRSSILRPRKNDAWTSKTLCSRYWRGVLFHRSRPRAERRRWSCPDCDWDAEHRCGVGSGPRLLPRVQNLWDLDEDWNYSFFNLRRVCRHLPSISLADSKFISFFLASQQGGIQVFRP